MAFLVISYPKLTRNLEMWLERTRQKHEPRNGNLLKGHFTLVFPAEGIERDIFTRHIQRKASQVKPIPFVLDKLEVVKDTMSGHWQIFLVPSKGYSEILNLHDQLYSGVLAPHLRTGIPYVPHITVGSSSNRSKAFDISAEIGNQETTVSGEIVSIDVVSLTNGIIRTESKIELYP